MSFLYALKSELKMITSLYNFHIILFLISVKHDLNTKLNFTFNPILLYKHKNN